MFVAILNSYFNCYFKAKDLQVEISLGVERTSFEDGFRSNLASNLAGVTNSKCSTVYQSSFVLFCSILFSYCARLSHFLFLPFLSLEMMTFKNPWF